MDQTANIKRAVKAWRIFQQNSRFNRADREFVVDGPTMEQLSLAMNVLAAHLDPETSK